LKLKLKLIIAEMKNKQNKKKGLNNFFKVSIVLIVVLVITVSSDSIKEKIQYQLKSNSLKNFYSNYASLQRQKNWSEVYELLPSSIKKFVTKNEYIKYSKGFYSINTTLNKFQINGDSAITNRTITACSTSSCNSNNKIVDTADEELEYQNGKWEFARKTPTDRAYEVAYFLFTNRDEKEKEFYVKAWSFFGTNSLSYAINNYALYLDKNQDELIKSETTMNEYLANRAKQNSTRTVVKTVPIFSAPVVSMPKTTHCRSDFMGGITCTTY
jgi:hypothetical protein